MIEQRRRILRLLTFGPAYALAQPVLASNLVTPRQMLGPFYPDVPPLDSDNDLTRVAGQNRVALGDLTHLTGRLLTHLGEPIGDA